MKYFSEIGSRSISAFKRFPLASLWAVIGTLLCMCWLEVDESNFFEFYRNEILVLSLGVSWLMATKFFIEQFSNPGKWWYLNLITFSLLAAYYFTLPEYSNYNSVILLTRWLLYLLAGHVFLFFAPFVRTWNSAAFWNYLKDIFIALGRSLLFSGVLYLGLVFALLAIDALFDLQIETRVYGQLFIFCLGIVNTGVYLSDFPDNIQQDDRIHYNRPLEVFVKFILVPLIAIYLLILYLYSLKILIAWELPEGWISNMISVLAILGFIIQIIIDPIRKRHPSFLIRKFYPWFYILLAPLLILLFVAVFRRISDYNFTESRYFLMLLSFWILGIFVYLLSSRKKQLRVLPISLFLLIVLSSFGPWGAFQVSARAQVTELREVFSEITAEGKDITQEKANRFQNIVRYLAHRNQLHRTVPVLGFNPETAFKDFDYYSIGNKILDSLEIRTDAVSDIFQTYYRNPGQPLVVEIEDMQVFTELQIGNHTTTSEESRFQMFEKNGIVEISENGNLLLKFDLGERLKSLISKYGNIIKAEPAELVFNFSNHNGSYRIIILDLSLVYEEAKPEISHLRAYLFYGRSQ